MNERKWKGYSGGLRDFPLGEGQHGFGVQPVERADQLAPEHVEAVQGTAFVAATVEPEAAPIGVRAAHILAEALELRLPFGAAVFGADCFRKRRIESVVGGDPEQLARR